LAILGAAVAASMSGSAFAASGAWSNTAGGNWELATPGNWTGGIVADGADSTADFSTIDITADTTVTLTEARTIGNLTFGDTATTSTGSWIVNGSLGLTLNTTTGTPQITVNTLGANKNVTLNVGIHGTGGFLKSGIGQLILAGTDNNWTGTTSVNRGTLTFANGGSLANVAAGSVLVNVAGAINYTPGVTDATFLSKISTSSTGAIAITATNAATNFDFTTGTLGTLGNMSIGAVLNNTVTYTGTITPAASTYRLGGGGGTIQVNSALIGSNSLIVGNGTNANGTVILNHSANTYTGTTTIATGATLQVGTGGTVATMSGALITNDGTFTLNRTGNFSFGNNISGAGTMNQVAGSMTTTGTISLGGAMNLTGQSTQTRWTNSGANVTFGGLVTLNSAGGGTSSAYFQPSGSSAFNAGINVGSSNDGCLLSLTGGTFTTTTLTVARSFNTGNSDTLPTSGQTGSGFYVNGATATMNDLRVSNSNAGGTARIDSGTVTVNNAIVLGGQNNSTAVRWSILDVNGGTLSVGGAGGITIGADSADHAERSILLVRGTGSVTTDKISYGDLATLTTGRSAVVVSDTASLYVGSGGIVTGAASGYTTIMNLAGGTLGAKADWTTAQNIGLTGATAIIKAADASDVAHNITIGGTITGPAPQTPIPAGPASRVERSRSAA
jgi:autotransporter-associated beta strand protein